jgi:hypothetical protein
LWLERQEFRYYTSAVNNAGRTQAYAYAGVWREARQIIQPLPKFHERNDYAVPKTAERRDLDPESGVARKSNKEEGGKHTQLLVPSQSTKTTSLPLKAGPSIYGDTRNINPKREAEYKKGLGIAAKFSRRPEQNTEDQRTPRQPHGVGGAGVEKRLEENWRAGHKTSDDT